MLEGKRNPMNGKLKVLLGTVLGLLLLHLLLTDCPFWPDIGLWTPSLMISAPQTLTILNPNKEDLLPHSEDLVTSVLSQTETANFSSVIRRMGNWTSDEVMLNQNDDMALCPVTPPGLIGPITVWMDSPTFDDLERLYPELDPGGHAMPPDCRARHRVAIIIPYRDREAHLRTFLHNMHALLQKQQLDYAIFVVEQIANETFNRAKLMNVGYMEAMKLHDWQCFVFHDVDLLPEDDRNLYSCPDQPRHMSVAVDKFHYRLPYGSIFGGITSLTRSQFNKINGFSNDYWGWGGEDDDLSTRVTIAGYNIARYPAEIARYKMIKHASEKENPINKCRYKLMYKTKTRWAKDGLTSLNYSLVGVESLPLFTHITVDLHEKQSRTDLREHGFPSC